MRKVIKFLLLTLFSLAFLFFTLGLKGIRAQSPEDSKLNQLNQQIQEYQNKITELKGQAATLSNLIAQFNAQIYLKNLEIEKINEQISILEGRIFLLEGSLESLFNAFSSRAVETYKMTRLGDPFMLIISASDLSEAVSRYHYLQKILAEDNKLYKHLEEAQTNYEGEKDTQEELQRQLEEQKQELGKQKSAKAYLLQITKNDEKRYQQLLAQARAEFEAIQAIIAGRGDESEAGHVNEGQRIASIIQGASCNSDGAHVHFIISEKGQTQNPFSYLRSDISYENCSGSGCGSGDGDAFNPGGSWVWPLNPTIEFNQGYGSTWAIRNTWVGNIYSFHNGIDINSPNSEVKAVKAGTLYRGSYVGIGACTLRYVRVDHDENDLESFYLHINY